MQLENLNTKFLAQNLYYYETIDSTQAEIWRRVKNKNIKNGSVVIADNQTNGKRNTWQKMVYRGKK